MDVLNTIQNPHFITDELVLKPLYQKIQIEGLVRNVLVTTNIKRELYCPKCKIKRIFTFEENGDSSFWNSEWSYYAESREYLSLRANADCDHKFIMIFKIYKTHVEKIGQYPSIYDMNEQINNRKFLNELSEEYKNYYTKACSLHSFNSNIGAMTYLRRIFEKLLIDSFNENFPNEDFEGFKKKRMEDKVVYLKNYLPSLLFEQGFNKVYQLISDGVHNLSEEECEQDFSTLKLAIEEVLIEKVQTEEKKSRLNSIKKQLQESASKEN